MTDLATLDAEPVPDEHVPPQDLRAEMSTLGSMLLARDAIEECLPILRASDFYRPAHELIYDAIVSLHGAGEPVDAVTVADELHRRALLPRIGGPVYLHDLVGSVPTAANVGHYAAIVAERAIARRLVEAGTRIVQIGRAATQDAAEAIETARAAVDAVAESRARTSAPSTSQDVYAALEDLERDSAGIPTPWRDLTEALGGWRPGSVYVVGARPGTGKTLVGIAAALDAARRGHRAHVASLEMSKSELYQRMLSAVASVDMGRMLHRRLHSDDWTALGKAAAHIAGLPITVSDDGAQRVVDIRSDARDLSRHGKVGVIVVDYLQLMSSGSRVESRQVEVAGFSRSLKLLARELECPVIVLSQLNRGPEQRADKRPTMADLRESGSVEQDADAVLLLHRDADKDPDRLSVFIEKHRHGEGHKRVELVWQARYARLGDSQPTYVPER